MMRLPRRLVLASLMALGLASDSQARRRPKRRCSLWAMVFRPASIPTVPLAPIPRPRKVSST